MIEVKHLQKIYKRRGKAVGLLDASFTVPDGQIVGVMGANGAGKTTLLRAIAGLLPVTSGTTLLDGKPAQACCERLSYITGDGSYYTCLTVGEYGAFLSDVHSAFDAKRYATFLKFFSLDARDIIASLSTGQRARVELAAGFAKRARFYLMDEPFLGKDIFTRRDFLKLMSGSLHGGETVLISTHAVEEVEHFLDRALILHEGKIAQDIDMEAMRESGQTLVSCMAEVCGYDANRYLSFEAMEKFEALETEGKQE